MAALSARRDFRPTGDGLGGRFSAIATPGRGSNPARFNPRRWRPYRRAEIFALPAMGFADGLRLSSLLDALAAGASAGFGIFLLPSGGRGGNQNLGGGHIRLGLGRQGRGRGWVW